MAIPKGILPEHVRAAFELLRAEGVPSNARSTKFDVVDPATGEAFPPKLVLSKAARFAFGHELSRKTFSGGEATNAYLADLGFPPEPKPGSVAQAYPLQELSPGITLTNDELIATFSVGNSGGMRWSRALASLVLVLDHRKRLYRDRWEGDVLHYTGTGSVGDQRMVGANRHLAQAAERNTPVHFFEATKKNVYVYRGLAQLIGTPTQEVQPGKDKRDRLVWVFPLRLGDAPRVDPIEAAATAAPPSAEGLTAPTRGPVPSSWSGEVTRGSSGEAWTYALRFGKRDLWKVGWAADVEARLVEINCHVPHEVLNERWAIVNRRRWPTATAAYAMEQQVLALLRASRTVGERVQCRERMLLNAWKESADQVAAREGEGAVVLPH